MMPAEITGYIDGAVKIVQSLKPDEAILLPGGAIFARSHAGTLRFGWGWPDTSWPRTRDVIRPVACANVGRRNFRFAHSRRAA